MAYINVISIGVDSVKCCIGGLDTSYSRYDRKIYWYLDGSYVGKINLSAYASESDNFTYTDLAPNTEYELYVEIEYTDSGATRYTSITKYVTTYEDTTGGDGYWKAVAVSTTTEVVPYEPPNNVLICLYGRVYAGELRYQKFKVTQTGTYRFYADSYDYSICGYLSDTFDYDERSGRPTSMLGDEAEGTDDGFTKTQYLEAGTTYYLWFRMYYFDESDNGYITVEYLSDGGAPGEGVEYNLGSISRITIQKATMPTNGYVRVSFSITEYGYISLFTTGNLDTYGYFSEEDCTWYEDGGLREPYTYSKSDANDGPGEGNCWINTYADTGQTLYFWIKCSDNTETGDFEIYIVPPQAGDLTLWNWNASNGDATDTQTSKAHTACTDNGLLSDFSHIVWNDMVYKVLECMVYKGFGWVNDYLSYGETIMSSGDTYITAARYNSLTTQLYYIDSSYSVIVNSGDLILGSHFTDITEEINYIIRNA